MLLRGVGCVIIFDFVIDDDDDKPIFALFGIEDELILLLCVISRFGELLCVCVIPLPLPPPPVLPVVVVVEVLVWYIISPVLLLVLLLILLLLLGTVNVLLLLLLILLLLLLLSLLEEFDLECCLPCLLTKGEVGDGGGGIVRELCWCCEGSSPITF